MYKNKPPICFGKKVAWLVMVKSRVNADCLRHGMQKSNGMYMKTLTYPLNFK